MRLTQSMAAGSTAQTAIDVLAQAANAVGQNSSDNSSAQNQNNPSSTHPINTSAEMVMLMN